MAIMVGQKFCYLKKISISIIICTSKCDLLSSIVLAMSNNIFIISWFCMLYSSSLIKVALNCSLSITSTCLILFANWARSLNAAALYANFLFFRANAFHFIPSFNAFNPCIREFLSSYTSCMEIDRK